MIRFGYSAELLVLDSLMFLKIFVEKNIYFFNSCSVVPLSNFFKNIFYLDFLAIKMI